MSRFSGKCDLFDYISMEKMYDHGSYLSSDELECFNIFKQRTGGVIYQYHRVEVTTLNQERVKQLCPQFDYKVETVCKPDKRTSSGSKTVSYYTYTYWGKEYSSLRELNKKDVYVRTPIKFDTLLDIIPYYPHIVTCASRDHDKETVIISNESYTDTLEQDALKYGSVSHLSAYYKKELQEHYLEVCKQYYLYKYDERVRVEPIVVDFETGVGTTSEDIDPLHGIEFVWKNEALPHWGSPYLLEGNKYQIHQFDTKNHLAEAIKNGDVSIRYIAKVDLPIYEA